MKFPSECMRKNAALRESSKGWGEGWGEVGGALQAEKNKEPWEPPWEIGGRREHSCQEEARLVSEKPVVGQRLA